MLHMSKSCMLYAVSVLFITFFALQFYLIHYVSEQREYGFQHAGQIVKRGAVSAAQTDRKKVTYDNANDFVALCQHNGVPVFLADLHLLQAVMSNTSKHSDCNFLCHTLATTTFAVVAHLWRNQDVILEQLHIQGFLVNSASQPDPWHTSSISTIPTHYMFQRKNHLVHLVILYERQPDFWWFGTCEWCRDYFSNGDNRHWVNHEGVIDQSDIIKVTMDKIPLRVPRYPKVFYDQLPHSKFIHCNSSRAEKFISKYGTKENSEEKAFKQEALDLLTEASKVLSELGIRFWMSSGTCLGWFRQCDIIPYSRDVDLGIWIKDYDVRLIPAMHMVGIPLKHLFGKVSDSFELSFQGGDVKLDIFFFYEDEHYMWNGGTQAKSGKKFKYLFPKFSLCWTLFLGVKVRVPCETRAYIEANYGLNWFEPVKQWDWKKSPPNVWENGEWQREEWEKVIRHY